MLSDFRRYRLYEILPGALIWTTVVVLFVLTFTKPLWVIYFIIVFDIYWVLRVIYFSTFLILGWSKFKSARKIDWTAKVQALSGWEEIVHVVFLPLYDEDYEVIKTTLEHLQSSSYPKEKIIVVLACEEKMRAHCEEMSKRARAEFAGVFRDFLVTMHPVGRGDEIPGKGSNIHYAGHEVQKYVDAHAIPYEKIIVSSFDIDTIVDRQYFSYLTHEYLVCPKPTRTSFQPVALFNNNMWESQSFIRIMAFGTSFWLLSALMRPDTMVTFSSHAMSFKALVDVGFWEKDIVSEDSRIFWQCFVHYKGDYYTRPLYIPVSMDTVRDDSWWKSFKNIYKQQRRWAWGTENIPYILWEFHKMKKQGRQIPWIVRAKYLFNQFEGKYSWGTTAIILFVFGRLPLWVAGENITQTVLFQNTPHILEWLMTFATLGIIISITLSLTLLPPAPTNTKTHNKLMMVLQWAFLPISLILVSAVPSIDAQTRLMLGKYLGFNVSAKRG
jgi:hypothetical protein